MQVVQRPQAGPIQLVAYEERGPGDEALPYVDLALRVFVRLNDTQIEYWTSIQVRFERILCVDRGATHEREGVMGEGEGHISL